MGRVGSAETGSRPAGQAASRLDATRFDPARGEFCRRFVERMIAVAGEEFEDGGSIREYAQQAAPTYYDEADQRAEGPEACADADISYWGD